MTNYLVSVVIPTYKRPFSMISKAVYSVINQSFKNIEIIIVDDSPNDYIGKQSLQKEIESIKDKRLKYIAHDFNKGACAARNTGIIESEGEYIAFLDDDDEWLLSKIEKQLMKFNDEKIGLVYCPYYIIENKTNRLRKRELKRGYLFKDLLNSNFIGSTSSIMVRRTSIIDVGMFDEVLLASQDYELYIRLALKDKIDYCEEPLLNYYIHKGDRISGDPEKKLQARRYIYNKYNRKIKEYPKINSKKHFLLAQSYSNLKCRKAKWKCVIKAIMLYPVPSKFIVKNVYEILFK